jgi:hypothetical protein
MSQLANREFESAADRNAAFLAWRVSKSVGAPLMVSRRAEDVEDDVRHGDGLPAVQHPLWLARRFHEPEQHLLDLLQAASPS